MFTFKTGFQKIPKIFKCLARVQHFSERSENSVGRLTYQCEAPKDTVKLVAEASNSRRTTERGVVLYGFQLNSRYISNILN